MQHHRGDNMKNLLIKSFIIIIILSIFSCLLTNNKTYASSMSKTISDGDSFLQSRYSESPINEEALQSTSNNIYNILFTIAVVLAFAIGMIIGIQFIMGSVDEKAKIKETLIPYIIGVFIIFSAFTIWKIAVNIGNNISPTQLATGGLPGYTGDEGKF